MWLLQDQKQVHVCEIKYNLMTYNNTYNLLSKQAKILYVTKVGAIKLINKQYIIVKY